ncbi:MAG: hypothetical protein IJV88_00830 [Ruminococcus sp.]|nr:hypothetical protein [Ruminococcus sp.]
MKSKFLRIMALVCSLAMLLTLCSCSVVFTKDIITEDRSHKTSEDVAHSEPEEIAESKPEEMQQSKDGFDTPEEAAQAYAEGYYDIDYDAMNKAMYGDFDYIQAMELYYDNIDYYYGEGVQAEFTDAIEDEYGTTDFREAYEQYRKNDFYHEGFVDFELGDECIGEDKTDIIDLYNSSIAGMCYASSDYFYEEDNSYAEFMVPVKEMMNVDATEVQEVRIVKCITDRESDEDPELYCMKVDGSWFVMAELGNTDYEHFVNVVIYD